MTDFPRGNEAEDFISAADGSIAAILLKPSSTKGPLPHPAQDRPQ
jgi:hypothetical protein